MTETTYYGLKIAEGSDIVNPLTIDNPNYEKIDEVLRDNAVSGVTLATEIGNAAVHAITRENSECAVIRFIATSEWKKGDSVTVDGVPVTALLPSGETLPDGAYVINANVLCILTGTNLTIYAERKNTGNADEITYNGTTVEAELNKLNNDLSKTNYIFTKSSAYTLDVSINVSFKAGILYTKVSSRVPIMSENSEITVGSISGWNHGGILAFCIIHSIGGNPQSVMVNIKADGTVTISTQSATTSQPWFYGSSAISL